MYGMTQVRGCMTWDSHRGLKYHHDSTIETKLTMSKVQVGEHILLCNLPTQCEMPKFLSDGGLKIGGFKNLRWIAFPWQNTVGFVVVHSFTMY